jgi:hypothetical protein
MKNTLKLNEEKIITLTNELNYQKELRHNNELQYDKEFTELRNTINTNMEMHKNQFTELLLEKE